MFGSRWYMAYVLLPGFDLLAILLSLVLNYNLLNIHATTVVENRKWAERLKLISDASREAHKVNVAANDIFVTDDVSAAKAKVNLHETEFQRKIDQLRTAIQQELPVDNQHEFFNYLDRAGHRMSLQMEKLPRCSRNTLAEIAHWRAN